MAYNPVVTPWGDVFRHQPTAAVEIATVEQGVSAAHALLTAMRAVALTFEFGDGALALAAGAYAGGLRLPYAVTLTQADVTADAVGSATVDVQTSPTGVTWTSITAAARPTLTAAQTATDATLAGWTTTLAAGVFVRAALTAVTGLKSVTVTLSGTR